MLASAEVSQQWVAGSDGARFWTVTQGRGELLVLCHGGPGLWDGLGPVAAMVDDLVRVVRWDQRGCGRSSGTGPHTVARLVDDLDAIRATVGADTLVVGGHSWGASLALAYACTHPGRIRGLLYLCGTGIGQDWHSAYHEEADRRRSLAERLRLTDLELRQRTAAEEHEFRVLTWSPDFARRATAAELAASLDGPFPINMEANRQLGAETNGWVEAELAERCRWVDAPAVLLHGQHDPRPVWAIKSLVDALPSASIDVIQDAGHHPWLEAPITLRSSIRAFLSGVA
ncbi:MAG TPA: alpha/beta hydrolase [Acidimicrobiales bacterium]|jgi:proline iminopeptidase